MKDEALSRLDDSIGYLISRAATDMRVALDRALEPYGVSSAQWVLLARIAREPAPTPAELAELVQISRPAVTGLVERMVEAGLVKRVKSPSDGRSYTLVATSSARSVLRDVPNVVFELNREFVRELSKGEQASLHALLTKLVRGLREQR